MMLGDPCERAVRRPPPQGVVTQRLRTAALEPALWPSVEKELQFWRTEGGHGSRQVNHDSSPSRQ